MSSTTIDYDDPKIDAGGDAAYDSSNYGTTTGDLSSQSHSQGDYGSGSNDASKSSEQFGSEPVASDQGLANQEHMGHSHGQAGQAGGNGGSGASEAPSGDDRTSDEKRTAQGYSKTNDMNPEIGA